VAMVVAVILVAVIVEVVVVTMVVRVRLSHAAAESPRARLPHCTSVTAPTSPQAAGSCASCFTVPSCNGRGEGSRTYAA
jgi:hypothetical protein